MGNMDILMEYKLRRVGKKIKLKDMTEYVGASYNSISLYECEHANMSVDKIQRYKFFIDNYEKEGVLVGK